MLSLLFLIQSLTAAANAQEVSLRVIGVQGQVLIAQSLKASSGHLGELTHEALERATLRGRLSDYRGSEAGILSLENLSSAIEILSDTEMNAYGWCYRVDGVLSNLLADQYVLTGQETLIEWFYAYAHLDKDQWTTMCTPADHEPTQELR
jgi:hypothetical protein